MEKEQLEVGDILYAMVGYCCRSYNAKYVIARVTKTLAISEKGTRFKRKISNGGHFSFQGSFRGYGSSSARIGTEEIEKKYIETKIRDWASRLNIKDLSVDKILKIKQIVEGE